MPLRNVLRIMERCATAGDASVRRLVGMTSAAPASSCCASGSQVGRSRRRARQSAARHILEGKLAAAFDNVRCLEETLSRLCACLGSPEVAARLQALAPCVAAQVEAAGRGLPSHTSRGLVEQDTPATPVDDWNVVVSNEGDRWGRALTVHTARLSTDEINLAFKSNLSSHNASMQR